MLLCVSLRCSHITLEVPSCGVPHGLFRVSLRHEQEVHRCSVGQRVCAICEANLQFHDAPVTAGTCLSRKPAPSPNWYKARPALGSGAGDGAGGSRRGPSRPRTVPQTRPAPVIRSNPIASNHKHDGDGVIDFDCRQADNNSV